MAFLFIVIIQVSQSSKISQETQRQTAAHKSISLTCQSFITLIGPSFVTLSNVTVSVANPIVYQLLSDRIRLLSFQMTHLHAHVTIYTHYNYPFLNLPNLHIELLNLSATLAAAGFEEKIVSQLEGWNRSPEHHYSQYVHDILKISLSYVTNGTYLELGKLSTCVILSSATVHLSLIPPPLLSSPGTHLLLDDPQFVTATFRSPFLTVPVWGEYGASLEISNQAFCLPNALLHKLLLRLQRRLKFGPQQFATASELGSAMFPRMLLNTNKCVFLSTNHPTRPNLTDILGTLRRYHHKLIVESDYLRDAWQGRYLEVVAAIRADAGLLPLQLSPV